MRWKAGLEPGNMTILLAGLACGSCLALAGPQPVSARTKSEPVAYGCSDIVVVGRVKSIGVTDLSRPDELLGSGRYDLQIRIKRVVRGTEPRRIVPATGFSHGQIREDSDVWLVLTPALEGRYTVKAANLTRVPYRLADACC